MTAQQNLIRALENAQFDAAADLLSRNANLRFDRQTFASAAAAIQRHPEHAEAKACLGMICSRTPIGCRAR